MVAETGTYASSQSAASPSLNRTRLIRHAFALKPDIPGISPYGLASLFGSDVNTIPGRPPTEFWSNRPAYIRKFESRCDDLLRCSWTPELHMAFEPISAKSALAPRAGDLTGQRGWHIFIWSKRDAVDLARTRSATPGEGARLQRDCEAGRVQDQPPLASGDRRRVWNYRNLKNTPAELKAHALRGGLN